MMTKDFLESIKGKLLQLKERFEKDLVNVGRKTGEQFGVAWEEYGSNEEENASEVAAFGDSLSVGYAIDSELKEVNAALKRLDDGTYGICQDCRQPIDEQRLLARPMSTHCMQCLKKGEAA